MPMGLYRSPKAASAEAPYVFVNPPANTYLHREVLLRNLIDWACIKIENFLCFPFHSYTPPPPTMLVYGIYPSRTTGFLLCWISRSKLLRIHTHLVGPCVHTCAKGITWGQNQDIWESNVPPHGGNEIDMMPKHSTKKYMKRPFREEGEGVCRARRTL